MELRKLKTEFFLLDVEEPLSFLIRFKVSYNLILIEKEKKIFK